MLVITIINLLSNKYFPQMAKIIINTSILTADYLLWHTITSDGKEPAADKIS